MNSTRIILGAGVAIVVIAVLFALRPDHVVDSDKIAVPDGAAANPDQAVTRSEAGVTVNADSASGHQPVVATKASEVRREAVGKAIEGVVIFEDQSPAPGATIVATPVGQAPVPEWERALPAFARAPEKPEAHRRIEAKSGADGRFRLEGVGSESWLLHCELEGYLAKDNVVAVVVARAGSRWTFELERATRVDIELVDATGGVATLMSASLTWTGAERTIYNAWTREQPYVRVPPGQYEVTVRSVASLGGVSFSTGVALAEPVTVEVGPDQRSLRIAVAAIRSLTVRVSKDPRFSPATKFYVVCRPEALPVGTTARAGEIREVGSTVHPGGRRLFDRLFATRYEISLRASRLSPPLLVKSVDLRESGQHVELDLASADTGDPIEVTFTGVSGDVQQVTIVACDLKDQRNSGIVITTTRTADQRYSIYLDRALRRRVLDARPDAKLALEVRHPRIGNQTFEIPLAATMMQCVLLEPATLRVTLENQEARRTAPGLVASLARFDGQAWQSICKPQDLAWVDEVTLGPVAPGECALVISSDFALDRPLLVEPITLVAGSNTRRVRVPTTSLVEFLVEGLSKATLEIEALSTGSMLQRVRIDAQSRASASLPAGEYRAIARDGSRYGEVEFRAPTPSLVRLVVSSVSSWTLKRLDLAGGFESLGLRVGDALVACDGSRVADIDTVRWNELATEERELVFGFERGGRRIEVGALPALFVTRGGLRREYFEPGVK